MGSSRTEVDQNAIRGRGVGVRALDRERAFPGYALLSLWLAALLALGCSRSESKPESRKDGLEDVPTLELRYQGNNGTVVPAELAEDLGYLAPFRLKFIGSTVSGPASIQAVVTGDTDFGGAFNGAVIKLVLANAPIVAVVGYYGVDDKRWSGFYVLNESPLKTARDLIDKKVAMNTLGAHSEFMVKEFLFRGKLTSAEAKQVMLVAIPPVNSEQALRQRQVDMSSLGDIYRDRAEENGGIRALFSDHELFGKFTAGSYVMKKDFIRDNPAAARKLVEAVGRAIEWSRTTPREEVVARMTSIIAKRGRNENAAVIKYWKSYGVAGPYARLVDRDFQLWIDWMVRDGSLKPGELQPAALYTNDLNPHGGERVDGR